jgi:uncharacterized protein with von Willebrand factor type A (vWA) domain
LRERDIARLTAAERAELAAMITLMRPGLPTRRSRRRYASHLGAADRRRTIRAMLAAGGEPVRPPRHRAGMRPRRIVLLIDVSGSMAAYADPLLRFAHVLVRQRPAATEVFTIGTRLSRVTRALTQRDPDVALRQAGSVIPDFSGGTRLGEVLKAFNDRWGQRGTAHGAAVVVFSDGWERGSCDLLAEQVERLHRLAKTVVWVNPHKGRDGYLPVQSGIVAALPFVDHFVAGHSLATLEQLLEVIRGACHPGRSAAVVGVGRECRLRNGCRHVQVGAATGRRGDGGRPRRHRRRLRVRRLRGGRGVRIGVRHPRRGWRRTHPVRRLRW